MCAAGQVLDGTATPFLVEQSPVSLGEFDVYQALLPVTLDSATSRGPPFLSAT
jgi:hypothetical protein